MFVFFQISSCTRTGAIHHLSCSPGDLRPRTDHGLLWNHLWAQADARVPLPSVRHLLNHHPGPAHIAQDHFPSARTGPHHSGLVPITQDQSPSPRTGSHHPAPSLPGSVCILCMPHPPMSCTANALTNHSSCSTGTCGLLPGK